MFEGKERIALRLENEHNQIWREEGGLTFFNKNNRVNFPGVKGKMKLSGVYFFFSCRLISPFIQTKGELKGVIPLCKFTPITTQKEVKK